MITKLSKKTMTGIFLLLIFVASAKGESTKDNNEAKYKLLPYDEIPKILSMISDKVQDNYKRIRTWEGTVTSETDYIYCGEQALRVFQSSTQGSGETPHKIINHNESSIEFSLDADCNSLYVHNYFDKPIKYTDADNGRDLGTKGIPSEERSILTKEYYIKCKPDRRSKNNIVSRKAIKQNLPDCSGCQKSPVFDPRESFEEGEPIWKTFGHILDQVKKDGQWKINGYTLMVEKSTLENITKYRIIIPGRTVDVNLVLKTMVFSSDKGFNIVDVQVTDTNNRLFQSATWDYELVDGIYLPKETTQQNYMGKDGGLSYNKKASFRNSQINHSIPEETFTYKNLGLENGDKFVDKIHNKEYIYQDKNLIPANKE